MEGRNGRCLKCDNSAPADSFQLANDALIAGEVVSNTCYRCPGPSPARSLIQKLCITKLRSRPEESCTSIEYEIEDVLGSLREREERELAGINFPLIFRDLINIVIRDINIFTKTSNLYSFYTNI